MEIILKQEVKGLGYKNELVTVVPGYARNYLIPQGIALVANSVNKKIALENIKQSAHKVAKHKQDAVALADKLSQFTLPLSVKAADNGKIFGAITALQLVEVLRVQTGYIADRRDISFQYPIKNLGFHKAMVRLHKDVVATIQINVVAEEAHQ